MALNTNYDYNVDLRRAKITFYDDGVELAYFELDNNIVTISAADEFSVIPTWGTNKDIKEWFNCIESMSGRMQLDEGQVRDGYEYEMKSDEDGVIGKIEANGETVGDWEWTADTGILTIHDRKETVINFVELRSFVQWMLHFQYTVQNFGG